jgi:hypothetical protein
VKCRSTSSGDGTASSARMVVTVVLRGRRW